MCAEFITLTNDVHIVTTPDYSNDYIQLSTTIVNPILVLLNWFYTTVLVGIDNIFDFISIFFLLNFWFFSFLIFIQGWELLINYTNYFNNKNINTNTNKLLGVITNKLIINTKNFIKYYTYY